MSWSTIVGSRIDALLKELDVALVERHLGYGFDNALRISSGTNIQSAALISAMQNAVNTAVQYAGDIYRFVNQIDGPLNVGEDDFLYWDIDSFCSATGLNNPDLWRRKANMEDDFSYGVIQQGDIIGPWIIEDLQAALNVLTSIRFSTRLGLEVGNLLKATTTDWSSADWSFGSGYEVDAFANKTTGELVRRTQPIEIAKKASVDADYTPRAWGGSGLCSVYIKGDSTAVGAFSTQGDTGVVEGAGVDVLRAGRVLNYPEDLINFDDGGPSPYGLYAIHCVGTSPVMPVSGTAGYSVNGGVRYLITPDFTYG